MVADRHATRRNKLLRSLKKEHKLSAILVTSEPNVTWLTGFTADSTWLYLSASHTILLSDTRYSTQIAEECPQLDVKIRDAGSTMLKSVAGVLRKAKPSAFAVEGDSLTHEQFLSVADAAGTADVVSTSGLTEKLRAVKDAGEIADIREAVVIAERGMTTLRAGLKVGQTELEIAHNLEHAMRGFGATRAGFDPIVAIDANGALPHAQPGNVAIDKNCVLLVDWGAETPGGYRSDLTRVLFTGRVSTKVRTVYEVVLKAQLAAMDAIRPGAACKDVDAIARGIIADAGYGKYFGHGLGHGFGLKIHEQPRLSPLSTQVLEPGMVVTVEPGIYLPGRFGIRIEDDILVTKGGYEVLSRLPKGFDDGLVEYFG